jgi:hypothetical protein
VEGMTMCLRMPIAKEAIHNNMNMCVVRYDGHME